MQLNDGDNVSKLTVNDASRLCAWPAWRNWNLDYFTSAFATPQLGTEILVPLVTNSLTFEDFGGTDTNVIKGPFKWKKHSDDSIQTGDLTQVADATYSDTTTIGGGHDVYLDTQAVAGSIRQFRLNARMQEYLERLQRVGDRYRDIIAGFYGIDPTPGTVDYAEFIGRSTSVVQISDVMSMTDSTTPPRPLGGYAGKALAGDQASGFTYKAKEHGFVMAIVNVQPMSKYIRGVERFWLQRSDKYDYPLDIFAGIGDQAILRQRS